MREIYRAIFFVVLLLACGLAASDARAENAAAESYVMGLVDDAVEILDDKEAPHEQRREAFRDFLLDNVDMRRLPAFLLGQYARLPDDEQKREYLELLQEFMARIYFIRLEEYASDAIEVTGSRNKNKGREVVVTGSIQLPNQQPLSLDWWLLRKEQDDGSVEFQVFDVRVAGIWLAQEQRSGFVSVIRNNRGDFDALLQHLRGQIDSQTASN